MLRLDFDVAGINEGLDALTRDAEDGTRVAAQAGAEVFYQEVRARVPVSAKIHATRGKKQVYHPGNLRAAIYQAFVDKESGKGHSTYRVSWNKTKAFYARFLETGTSRMPARPFLRPAYDAVARIAAEAAQAALVERIKGRRA